MTTRADYRIIKKVGRQVFNLKDMLAVVEALEEEVMANERSEKRQKREHEVPLNQTNNEVLETQLEVLSDRLLQKNFILSNALKQRWAHSLKTVRRIAVQNKEVYPKIIEELDELHENRVNERISSLKTHYEQIAGKDKQKRLQKLNSRKEQEKSKMKAEAIAAEQKLQEKKLQEKQVHEKLLQDKRLREKQLQEKKIQEEKLHEKKIQEQKQAQNAVAVNSESNLPIQPTKVETTEIPKGCHKAFPELKTVPENSQAVSVPEDSRIKHFLSQDDINRLILSWKERCSKLLKPGSKEEKDIAMKIKRAVAVPVGALTQRSGEDLKAQIGRIINLIKKKDLPAHEVTGDFVIHEIAVRFVSLAAEQLSSNDKAAPAVAAAIIALWLTSNNFGEVFMAYLYQLCPLLIQNAFNETVDEQKFKQMSGMCRLFSALASSDCPPGLTTHPFGIENIWKFIVGTILATKATELTTQALYEVLIFSGKRLQVVYKGQFEKLIRLISQSYIPKATGPPATRLKLLLADAQENGFKNPPGALTNGFWESTDMYTGKVAGE